MLTHPQAEPIPLESVEGIICISGTRIPLQTVIRAFQRGASAEAIVDQYPTLALSEVYLVIGYYLQHRAEVDDYLAAQDTARAEFRTAIEQRFPPMEIRARLLARQAKQDRA